MRCAIYNYILKLRPWIIEKISFHSEGFVISIQWESRASHSVEGKRELSNSGLDQAAYKPMRQKISAHSLAIWQKSTMQKCHIQSYSGQHSIYVTLCLGSRKWKETGCLVFMYDKPPSYSCSLAQSRWTQKSKLVFNPFGIPSLPWCVPCFNFPPIIMFPFALFTVHLRFLFNWKLVWIWILQTERKYLLNKCACELITCQDLQARGQIEETWESTFVHHLALCKSFTCHARL